MAALVKFISTYAIRLMAYHEGIVGDLAAKARCIFGYKCQWTASRIWSGSRILTHGLFYMSCFDEGTVLTRQMCGMRSRDMRPSCAINPKRQMSRKPCESESQAWKSGQRRFFGWAWQRTQKTQQEQQEGQIRREIHQHRQWMIFSV